MLYIYKNIYVYKYTPYFWFPSSPSRFLSAKQKLLEQFHSWDSAKTVFQPQPLRFDSNPWLWTYHLHGYVTWGGQGAVIVCTAWARFRCLFFCCYTSCLGRSFCDIPLRTLGSQKTNLWQVQNQSSTYRVICRICLAYISLKTRAIAANHAANRWQFGVILVGVMAPI